MGQYYRPVVDTGNGVIVFNREVNGRFTVAKLMEHSWWKNEMVAAVMFQIAKYGQVRLAWVGDYADEDENVPGMNITPKEVWSQDGVSLERDFLYPDGLFLLNHNQKCFLDLDDYRQKVLDSKVKYDDYSLWVMHPLPLLTALGNGRGGGDYYESNIGAEMVGSWCGDIISLTKVPPGTYSEEKGIFIPRAAEKEKSGC